MTPAHTFQSGGGFTVIITAAAIQIEALETSPLVAFGKPGRSATVGTRPVDSGWSPGPGLRLLPALGAGNCNLSWSGLSLGWGLWFALLLEISIVGQPVVDLLQFVGDQNETTAP